LAETVLNVVDGVSSGLTICLFQLAEPNKILALSQTKSGLLGLLGCAPETAGALSAERYFIQPGQTLDLILDRLEKARYLAVVAGYQDLRPNLATAILPMPIQTGSKYLIFKTYGPEILDAWLILKAQNMQFFAKNPKDYGRLAKDLKPGEPKNAPKELETRLARAPIKVDPSQEPITISGLTPENPDWALMAPEPISPPEALAVSPSEASVAQGSQPLSLNLAELTPEAETVKAAAKAAPWPEDSSPRRFKIK
jgi:hypothetical protein